MIGGHWFDGERETFYKVINFPLEANGISLFVDFAANYVLQIEYFAVLLGSVDSYYGGGGVERIHFLHEQMSVRRR